MARPSPPRVLVLGDLMLDIVLAPVRALEMATDVPGHVSLRQGGSAATTARWLSRLGARSTFVTAVGRDPEGRALVDAVRSDKVTVRAVRKATGRTGRIGVVVAPGGERSFVADRGVADLLAPDDLRPEWFERIDLLHLPGYSLLGEPLGSAGRHAVALARAAGGRVSLDLASSGPLLSGGRVVARGRVSTVAPDLLFATSAEADALLGPDSLDDLLELAPVVCVKRGARGATVLARDGADRLRFEVATEQVTVDDTTGAGDAFDAGFIVGWLAARAAGRGLPTKLQRGALAGHRAATRHLTSPRVELRLG